MTIVQYHPSVICIPQSRQNEELFCFPWWQLFNKVWRAQLSLPERKVHNMHATKICFHQATIQRSKTTMYHLIHLFTGTTKSLFCFWSPNIVHVTCIAYRVVDTLLFFNKVTFICESDYLPIHSDPNPRGGLSHSHLKSQYTLIEQSIDTFLISEVWVP